MKKLDEDTARGIADSIRKAFDDEEKQRDDDHTIQVSRLLKHLSDFEKDGKHGH